MWMVLAMLVAMATCPCEAQVSEKDAWLANLRNESASILKCGRKSYCSRSAKSDSEFNARCHCDPECTALRDCCVDRAVSDAEVAEDAVVRGVSARSWGCGRLGYTIDGNSEIRLPQHVSMVRGCPDGHPLSGLCERRPDDAGRHGYLLDVAVLGASTDIWYRNLYCAACNGEKNLRQYRPSVACSFGDVVPREMMEQASYVDGNLTWVFPNGSMCGLQLALNGTGVDDAGWLRSCPEDMVTECPEATTAEDPSLAEKCRAYALFSLDLDKEDDLSPTYKNPHCALCHGVQPKCRPMFQGRVYSSGPSLTFVLDISWESSSPGPSWNCTLPHGLWDVLHGSCIAVDALCGEGLVFDGTTCAPATPGVSEGSCAKITLAQHEYHADGSGGIALNSTLFALYEGHVFDEGQFERLANGSVAICRSLLQEVYDALVLYSSAAQVYITVVCLLVSTSCLVLHIATYCLLPKLCNLPGKNLVALSWALLLAQLLLLVGVRPVVDLPRGACIAVGLAVQYFFLAAFCWMNVMSLDIWRTFSSSLGHANSSRTYRKYSAYAWGVPALISTATLVVDLAGQEGDVRPRLAAVRDLCWFGSRIGQAVFFTAPVAALLAGNAALFGITVYKLHRHTRDNYRYIRRKNKEELSATLSRSSATYPGTCPPPEKVPSTRGVAGSRDEARFYLYLKLFVVMGMTWIFGFLATLAKVPALVYPFLVLNGMQGAFIFFMFDFKRSIGRMLWERLVGRRRAVPTFLDSKGSGTNNSSSNNQFIAKKKISQTSTSSSLLSSGTFRPISSMVQYPDLVGSRVSSHPRVEEAVELMGSRTSGMALLPQNLADSSRLTGDGTHHPEHWLHKLPQSEVT